jgi:hypothetical protein
MMISGSKWMLRMTVLSKSVSPKHLKRYWGGFDCWLLLCIFLSKSIFFIVGFTRNSTLKKHPNDNRYKQ